MLGSHHAQSLNGIADTSTSMYFDSPTSDLHMGSFSADPSSINPSQRQSTTPNFLFGSVNKRRSLAVPPSHYYHGLDGNELTPSRDDSNIFSSNVPPHLTPASTVGKSVHWSPALVRIENVSPRATPINLDSSQASSTSYRSGPPLRSITDELRAAAVDSSVLNGTSEGVPGVDVPMEQSPTRENGNDGELHWVTVFGFAPEDATHVLQLFSRHGTIVAHRFAERGNWVYIRYSSVVHAQQALSRNGHIIEGRLRLGVMPIDPSELASLGEIAKMDSSVRTSPDDENASSSMRSGSALPRSLNRSALRSASFRECSYRDKRLSSAPLNTSLSVQSPSDSFNSSYRLRPSASNRSTMRSLSAAYNSADNQFNVCSLSNYSVAVLRV
ncbi:unnamed protein product [Anisakis simplex]|uniref:Nucleoporin NUP35 n=1 Tax=Anisakis simplex TaxID=6269 RepID=A0A0M3JXX8_ANISI|nr:unnamed protein product [Anisakis simplex]